VTLSSDSEKSAEKSELLDLPLSRLYGRTVPLGQPVLSPHQLQAHEASGLPGERLHLQLDQLQLVPNAEMHTMDHLKSVRGARGASLLATPEDGQEPDDASDVPDADSVAVPRGNIAMWQHTNTAPYAGTNVDETYSFGSVEQLRSYGKPEPAKPSADRGQKGAAPRFLVTKRMMARTAPEPTAVKFPVQMVHAGAVLHRTGKQTAHWVPVVAGGHPVWILLANTKPA
jgi:hypothetical protein